MSQIPEKTSEIENIIEIIPEYDFIIVDTPFVIKNDKLFEGQDIEVIINTMGKIGGLYFTEILVKKFTVSDLSIIKESIRQKYQSAKYFKLSCEWLPDNMRVSISFQI